MTQDHKVTMLAPYRSELLLTALPIYSSEAYELRPFDPRTIAFFDSLSRNILADTRLNRLPEMVALGFWMRKANILAVRSANEWLFNSKEFVVSPLGRVFHICPANVDTMFVYSLAVSILMGNKNVLRVSTRMNEPHIDILFGAINSLLSMDTHKVFSEYINIINYSHSAEISTYISSRSNARVIWGGDETVLTFKGFRSAPRTKDIVFADRVSALLIRAEAYLALDEKGRNEFARLFFNDGYTFDQMGCSSPQTLYFIGNENVCNECQTAMTSHLQSAIRDRYDTEIASLASLKLNKMMDDIVDDAVTAKSGDSYITFLELKGQTPDVLRHGCGGGYFYTRRISSVGELQLLQHAKVQTLSHFGLTEEDHSQLISLVNGEGIDRVVPLGQSLTFNYIWDGYNLLDELSRKVFIQR